MKKVDHGKCPADILYIKIAQIDTHLKRVNYEILINTQNKTRTDSIFSKTNHKQQSHNKFTNRFSQIGMYNVPSNSNVVP